MPHLTVRVFLFMLSIYCAFVIVSLIESTILCVCCNSLQPYQFLLLSHRILHFVRNTNLYYSNVNFYAGECLIQTLTKNSHSVYGVVCDIIYGNNSEECTIINYTAEAERTKYLSFQIAIVFTSGAEKSEGNERRTKRCL